MLYRDLFSSKIIFIIIMISSSFFYKLYKEHKYSNCIIENRSLVSINKTSMEIEFTNSNKKLKHVGKIVYQFDGIILPQFDSDNSCEVRSFKKMRNIILSIVSDNSVEFNVNKCNPNLVKKTKGTIRNKNGSSIESILLNNKVAKKTTWNPFHKVDWCK